jgi:hypothetical protein
MTQLEDRRPTNPSILGQSLIMRGCGLESLLVHVMARWASDAGIIVCCNRARAHSVKMTFLVSLFLIVVLDRHGETL